MSSAVAVDTPAEPEHVPSRRERWEAVMEWPLTVTALVFLGAYAWPILQPDLVHGWRVTCGVLTAAAYVVFVVDYVVRVSVSHDRPRFLRTHVPELLIVVLPALRPLRMLQLLNLLGQLNRSAAGSSFRGRVAAYVASATTLVVFTGALAGLKAERGAPGANIETFGDAVWWAMTTVSTVGYGDFYPVTTTGRLVAAVLMLAGIALLGAVTASLASWLIDRVSADDDAADDAADASTRADLSRLLEEVTALRAEVAEIRPRPSTSQERTDGAPGTVS